MRVHWYISCPSRGGNSDPTGRRRCSLLDDNPAATRLTNSVRAICTYSHVNYTFTSTINADYKLNTKLSLLNTTLTYLSPRQAKSSGVGQTNVTQSILMGS